VDGTTPNLIYTCMGTMSADMPPPSLGFIGPWRAGGGGVKTQKWGVISFVHKTATISIFLSVAKCGSICRAQTCAHSCLKPSEFGQGVSTGGPKSSKKFRIFHNFETLRPYIAETIKNRGIQAAYGKSFISRKKLYISHIQLSHRSRGSTG